MPELQDSRARRRAETHRRIYRTAMDLFRERGYEAVTVGRIAAAAGVSVPTFYDHFPSKEHVVLHVVPRGEVERLHAALPAGLSLPERVHAGLYAWIASLQEAEREELLERWRIVVTTPGLRTRAAEFERIAAAQMLDVVAPRRDGAAAEMGAEVVVAACFSAYTAALLRWAEDEGRTPLEDVAKQVLTALQDL